MRQTICITCMKKWQNDIIKQQSEGNIKSVNH